MPREGGWLGIFATPGEAADAVVLLREAGVPDVRAAMPAPYPEVERAFGRSPSRLGWITFGGALTGGFLGYLFAAWTAVDWPLNIGGRPMVSLVPYTVIGFESAILIGALSNLTAVLVGVARARRQRAVPAHVRFSENRLGIFVPDSAVGSLSCESLLVKAGAREVQHVAG